MASEFNKNQLTLQRGREGSYEYGNSFVHALSLWYVHLRKSGIYIPERRGIKCFWYIEELLHQERREGGKEGGGRGRGRGGEGEEGRRKLKRLVASGSSTFKEPELFKIT